MTTWQGRRERRGISLICVLAVMFVVTSLTLSNLQMALRTRSATKSHMQVRQAELLCDAAMNRAIEQLTKSREYQGETWLAALAEGSGNSASTEIMVERNAPTLVVKVKTTLRKDYGSSLDEGATVQRSRRRSFSESQFNQSEN